MFQKPDQKKNQVTKFDQQHSLYVDNEENQQIKRHLVRLQAVSAERCQEKKSTVPGMVSIFAELFSVLILDLRPRQKGTFCVFHLSDLTQTDCVSIQIGCGQNKPNRVEKYRLLESETLEMLKENFCLHGMDDGKGRVLLSLSEQHLVGKSDIIRLVSVLSRCPFQTGSHQLELKNTNKKKYFIN